MGLLQVCYGGGSASAVVQPQLPSNGGPSIPDITNRPNAVPENAQTLVGMLTRAQQMELQSAFRQFDVNGNGTMCVTRTERLNHARRRRRRRLGHCVGPT